MVSPLRYGPRGHRRRLGIWAAGVSRARVPKKAQTGSDCPRAAHRPVGARPELSKSSCFWTDESLTDRHQGVPQWVTGRTLCRPGHCRVSSSVGTPEGATRGCGLRRLCKRRSQTTLCPCNAAGGCDAPQLGSPRRLVVASSSGGTERRTTSTEAPARSVPAGICPRASRPRSTSARVASIDGSTTTRLPDGRDTASFAVPRDEAVDRALPPWRFRTNSREQLLGSLRRRHGREESSGLVPRRSSKSAGCTKPKTTRKSQGRRGFWPAARAQPQIEAFRIAVHGPGGV